MYQSSTSPAVYLFALGNKDSRYHRHMEQDGILTCDSCGQRIPPMSKLAARRESPDGKDLCLACQIRLAQIEKGLRH
jgi:RNA polymerase-binding transcription factor DksA